MKKTIIVLLTVSLIGMGTVSGSSKNGHGEFKGNPIVKITSDGKLISSSNNFPAILVDGEPYVPVNVLKSVGMNAVWNSKNQILDVSKVNRIYKFSFLSISQIYELTKSAGVESVQTMASKSQSETVFHLSKGMESWLEDDLGFWKVIYYGSSCEATMIRVVDPEGNEFTVPTDIVVKFKKKEVQDIEVWKAYRLNGRPIYTQ